MARRDSLNKRDQGGHRVRTARSICALVLAASAETLAACASPQSIARLDTARADFKERVRPAQMMIQYDLAHPGRLTPAELARREADAAKAFSPMCAKPYAENLHASVDAAAERAKASGSLAPAEALPETARLLDREFDKCVAKFGVVGFNFFQLEDGRELRAPDYLSETIASLHAWGDARATVATEQQDSAALVVASLGVVALAVSGGANVNSDQTYVGQYRRRDGTVVRGHWRTNPNETCLDNIRGCR
jgi:hypothetical protein